MPCPLAAAPYFSSSKACCFWRLWRPELLLQQNGPRLPLPPFGRSGCGMATIRMLQSPMVCQQGHPPGHPLSLLRRPPPWWRTRRPFELAPLSTQCCASGGEAQASHCRCSAVFRLAAGPAEGLFSGVTASSCFLAAFREAKSGRLGAFPLVGTCQVRCRNTGQAVLRPR